MGAVGQTVRGYFSDRNAATEALQRLRQAGFSHARMDLARPEPGGEPTGSPFAGPAGLEASAELVDNLSAVPAGPGPLPSVPPSAGSFSSGGHGWTVVAHTDGSDTEIERAVKILKFHGGDV